MELIVFIQVFNIIVIAIGTLFYMCCRSLTFSSSSSSSASDSVVADSAVVDFDDDDDADADIPPSLEKYDVFISFRGKDTRDIFTCHLHEALVQKKIDTYIDNRLKRGEEIGPALLEAIEKSKFWVIIFSPNYATSTWCLDELVHIMECNKNRGGQFVIPIFYRTNVSDVRDRQGSYAAAVAQHQSIDKVDKWKEALTNAANISGFPHPKNAGTDADLIKKVVKDIWTKLGRESSCNLEGLVGIESSIKKVEELLDIHSQDGCLTVGIWGMGGIGKTTLAEAVFHKHSSKFDACCFLRNVTEREQKDGLENLEKTLLKEILKEEGLSIGSDIVRERLSKTKVLIVLDDVSNSTQMEHLAGKGLQYGTGSRIIITSRDRRTLTVEEGKIYKVKGLKPDDALQFFYLRAFKNNSTPGTDFKELAEKAAYYARGVPLALKLLGSSFLYCESIEDWKDELDKLKESPNEGVQRVLKLSYDRLGRYEKDIFLDIACFHKGMNVNEVKKRLAIRTRSVAARIKVLIDMSLISVHSEWGRETIEMHDLLEEMGRTVVLEQGIEDPGKRSRLFNDEDVFHVLKSNTETPNVQAIKFNWSQCKEQPFERADFKVMSNLKLLIVDYYFGHPHKFTTSLDLPNSLRYLHWWKYLLESLPSNFSPENLVELHMPYSQVKKLWKKDQILVNLEVIDLHDSQYLIEAPNLSGSLKIVNINLSGCARLVEIPGCFQRLHKLTHLRFGCCTSLKYLPEMPGSIEYLDLQSSGIKELPKSVWSNENISYLNMSHCKDLEKLPSNRCKLKVSNVLGIESCTSLGGFSELPRDITKLSLVDFKRLVSLPTNICKLKYLEELNLSGCSELEKFPEILEPMEHLVSLSLQGTAVEMLPSSIGNLISLQTLDLSGCKHLVSLPTNICKLKYLVELNLSGCSELEKIPEILEPMEHLVSLSLQGTAVEMLPLSIGNLISLQSLDLSGCKHLVSLPTNICQLKYLVELNLSGCSELEKFPEILEPMEHLSSLSLQGTVVEMLPSSIGNLISLQTLDLSGCKHLVSLPTNICKLKYLVELNLSGCSELEKFPEILEPMKHLVSLSLQGTAVEMLPSSIGNLISLQSLYLSGCKHLVSLPTNICKLKYLVELNLSGCSELEKIPEILEPMEHLVSRSLQGTAVEMLPLSIGNLISLQSLYLSGCKHLVSLPTNICQLKYLVELNLSGCSELEKFPEILEPMKHLMSLSLQGTAVEMLPSSIGNLISLQTLDLSGCKHLVSLPTNICQLKYLVELNLSGCSELEKFPEILEPMKHLMSLSLQGTAVEMLPSSIGNLISLQTLDFSGCKHLVSLPTNICKLKYLEELNLSGCSELEKIPEILEPMEHLVSLSLQGTAVEMLPSSIGNLISLQSLDLSGCKHLVSLPTNICQLKYLVELNLSGCSELEKFPEILEPMEHLVSLSLQGTAVEMLPSSSGNLISLQTLDLSGCKHLVSLPTNICKLKYLVELNLSGCSELEKFPEILEPMKHLVSLSLQGTAVEMLPSSIGNLISLQTLDLCGCKHLVSLPTNICKLKYLVELNLSGCSELEKFPEILEPMKHLVSLSLQGTAVEMLPSSIGNLISLQTLDLCGCKHLVSLPTNICKLKYLVELNLSGCSELEKFPEILEPMKHLVSLSLQGTAVEMLPSSIGNLISLQTLDLCGCKHLVSLPTNICKLKYLVELNLSGCSELEKIPEILEPKEHLVSLSLQGTAVEMFPLSIGNLIILQSLDLSGCKHLVSLPTNICQLKYLVELNLSGCSELEKFPEILEPMEHLVSLSLQGTAVEMLPLSIGNLISLQSLDLSGCKHLVSLPTNFCQLKYLVELNLSGCSELEKFPEILEPMEHLVSLSLQGTAVEMLPSSIGNLFSLQTLDLSGCKHLKDVPTSIYSLTYLRSLNFHACPELKKLPSSFLGSLPLKGFDELESRIKQIESLLGNYSHYACISVGIWGVGGIGKTTLAEAVFRRLSSRFEVSCFLNVRENSEKADGLDHLEKTLLKEILKEEGLSMGSTFVRKRLSRTKVLIVLDDVSDSMQMEGLAGNRLWFGHGSRIIITSRNRGTLRQIVEEDMIYAFSSYTSAGAKKTGKMNSTN